MSKADPQGDKRWLIFLDEAGVGTQLQANLHHNGDVISVRAGHRFDRIADDDYVINPRDKDDYAALLTDLRRRDQLPTNIVHLWTVSAESDEALSFQSVDEAQYRGFYSLLYLAQAIGDLDFATHIQLDVISNGLYAVTGDERLCPEKATVLGPCRVIPVEYPNIACHNIDIVLPTADVLRKGRSSIVWLAS